MTGRLKTVNKTNFYKARAKPFVNFSYKDGRALNRDPVITIIIRDLRFDSA